MKKRLNLSRIIVLIILASLMSIGSASAFGPYTMYQSPTTDPSPGTLYPRVLTLKYNGVNNGTMLATFEHYVNGTPTFPIYQSTDGGVSWTKISEVSDQVNGWGMRYQPFLYELPQTIGNMPAGTLLCAGNSIPGDLSKTKLDLYKSTDRGITWSFVSSIASGGRADPNGSYDPVWEPFLLVFNNKLIVYYADERDPNHNQKLVHQTSSDGITWGSLVHDIALSSTKRPGMPVVAKLGNGNYIFTYEYGGAPEANFAIYYKISANPENFGAADVPGTVIQTKDGFLPTSSPYVTWLSGTGPNGTIAVSAYNTSDIFLNAENGSSSHWTRVSSVVPSGYSRALEPLADNHNLFIITAGNLSSTSHNSVKYGSKEIGDANLIKRWESHRYPGYYARHYDFLGKIDPDPINPINDSKFRMVPGLADPAAISFESINFPGYYLRHYDYKIRLDKNSGTSTFNKDATFFKVPGLADSTKVSFKSYNFTSRYIRQYNYGLRIDSISTATEKSDATFIEH
ncbi:MAG TPA: AbfB domain-containing protein [Bacilli bacterium]